MSDPLNPYPGNLRRHIVDNSDLQVLILRTNDMEGLEHVRDIYEAARAKDAELIQRLVDASSKIRHWHDAHDGGMIVSGDSVRGLWSALSAADARGFKPTEQ